MIARAFLVGRSSLPVLLAAIVLTSVAAPGEAYAQGGKAPAAKGKGKGNPKTPPPTTAADATPPTTAPTTAPATPTEPTPPPPPAEAANTTAPEAAPPAEDPDKPAGFLFDGDVGIPKLKSNETSLAFDLHLGYQWRHFGIGGYASMYNYGLQSDARLTSTQRVRYGLEARYLTGLRSDDVRYEIKVEANAGAFNTTTIDTGNTGNGGFGQSGFSTENSSISRLTLLLGRRARVSEAFRYKLSVGAGSQFDTYFRAASGNDAGEPELDLRTTVRFLARAEARYAVVPGALDIRPEAEFTTFEIRRLPTFVGANDAQNGAVPAVAVLRENDFRLRLFADVEKLSFGGLMPGAFVGLDYVAVSGDAGSTSALIPIFGVGLINTKPKD